MKKLLLLGFVSVIVFSGCTQPRQVPDPAPIGGDRDDHGCLIGAGYSWCESKQKCLRTWEEPCEQQKEVQCKADSDCVPRPCDCHPHECLNKTLASNLDCMHEGPCTEIFDCSAAYDEEDCLCKNSQCVNGNEGGKCNR